MRKPSICFFHFHQVANIVTPFKCEKVIIYSIRLEAIGNKRIIQRDNHLAL